MKKILAILLSLTLVLGSVGCSKTVSTDSKDGEVTKTAEKVKNAQGVTDTSVKVGNGIAVSGAFAPVGIPFKMGIQAYFNMVNEAGGVSGRKIEYVHQDDEFKPENGKAVVEKMINDEKVFALVGHFGTPVVAATLEDIKDAGIPSVYFATGIGALFNENAKGRDRGIFPVQPIYVMEGKILSAYAQGYFKAKTVGVIYSNDDAGKDLFKGIEAEAKTLGLTLVTETIQPGATDATAQVQKMKNADIVIAAAIQATFPTIIKEMEKQDIMKPVITTYVNVSKTLTTANAPHIQKLMHNDKAGIFGLGWVNIDPNTDDYKNFVANMKKLGAKDADMNAYAMTGWIASSFFVEGLKRVGSEPLTWENYFNALEKSPVKNPFGGTIDFSNGKRLGTQEMNLSKMNDKSPMGWDQILPIQSMDKILGK